MQVIPKVSADWLSLVMSFCRLDSAHGGSSLESSDYVSTSGMVVFEQQETSKDITIPCKATHKV